MIFFSCRELSMCSNTATLLADLVPTKLLIVMDKLDEIRNWLCHKERGAKMYHSVDFKSMIYIYKEK